MVIRDNTRNFSIIAAPSIIKSCNHTLEVKLHQGDSCPGKEIHLYMPSSMLRWTVAPSSSTPPFPLPPSNKKKKAFFQKHRKRSNVIGISWTVNCGLMTNYCGNKIVFNICFSSFFAGAEQYGAGMIHTSSLAI